MKQALVILLIFGLIHQMLTATVPTGMSTTTKSSISNEASDMSSSEEESVTAVRAKRGNCNKGAEKLTLGSQSNGTVLVPNNPPTIDIRGPPQPIG